MKPLARLTRKERRFMAIMYPTGTVAVGLTIGRELYHRGLLLIAKAGRYGLSARGAEAMKQYLERERQR